MIRHSLVSHSSTICPVSATVMARTITMTRASNSNVKPLPGRAQGTDTCLTPQPLQVTRGTRACRKASCWKKFKCRQVFSSVS
jgi:hypothetical protein